MGGGGTLWAASELGNKVRCAVPLEPWQPGQRFAMITAPTLIIAAELDDIAGVADNARVHYDSIPTSVEKIFAEFKGADHYLTTNRTTMWDDQARVMVSFYKLKLEDDTRYAAYLYGGMEPKAALSRYEFTKKP
jgi:dienelactone hydrolase